MDPPRTTLCPGYTHVSEFSPSLSSPKSRPEPLAHDPELLGSDDGDEEYEEEIEYVVLDLGSIEPTLVPSSSSYRLIGLDSPTPFLQLSGTILQGRHENLLGSELIFTDDKADSASAGEKKRGVAHVATTSKRITFKEVRLRPKDKPGQIPAAADTIEAPVIDESDTDEGLEYYDGDPGITMGLDMSTTMEVDDALEYVDLDVVMADNSTSAGPSRLPSSITRGTTAGPAPEAALLSPALDAGPPAQSAPSSPLHGFPQPESIPSFTSFISEDTEISTLLKGKGKEKPRDGQPVTIRLQDENEIDHSIDPALRIDRLTGISPPLTRAPRGSKTAPGEPVYSVVTSAVGMEAVGGSAKAKGKAKARGKAKEKANRY